MTNSIYTRKAMIKEIVSFAILFISLIFSIVIAVTYKGDFATRYSFDGEIEDYGSAATMLIMPIVMIFCNGIISITLHLVPTAKWNMPVKVNPERAWLLYRDSVYMMVDIQVILAVYTAVMTLIMYLQVGMLALVASLWLVIVLGFVIIKYLRAMSRHNK